MHINNSKKENKIQNKNTHKRSVETEKQKGKRLASVNENLTQYSTPSTRGAEEDRNHTQQKTTRKIAIIGKEHMHQQTLKNQFRTSYSKSSRTK